MTDLVPERAAVKQAIEDLLLQPVLAEEPGAHHGSPRDVTLAWVKESDIYVGIFWQRYGDVPPQRLSATEEEYQMAQANCMPILIYVKQPAEGREILLSRFLQEIDGYEHGHFRATFQTPGELAEMVKRDVMHEVSRLVKADRAEGGYGKARLTNGLPPYGMPQLEGVLGLLRTRILTRAMEQLEPSVKRFQTMAAVEQGCRIVASKVAGSGFQPEIVLGWRDQKSSYRGSDIVSEILADQLQVTRRLALMEEIGERRKLIEPGALIRGLSRVLVVDDACYSGSTLKAIDKGLRDVDAALEIHFAVLSTSDPGILPNLYFAATHKTEELLFPWGWSRLIVGLYDVYKLFHISDRRVVSSEATDWGSTALLAEEFSGQVRLLTIRPGTQMRHNDDDGFDTFLYVLKGPTDVRIAHKTGRFRSGEYLFIPRGIAYTVVSRAHVQLLELLSRGG